MSNKRPHRSRRSARRALSKAGAAHEEADPPGTGPLRNRLLTDPLNLVALLFGLVWGIVAVFFRPIGDYGVETDFYGDFAKYAAQWANGEATPMNGFRGPGYYLMLAYLSPLLGDMFLTAKALSVASAAVGIRVLGGLVRRLWNEPMALAAMLFIAARPVFMEHAYRAGSDFPFWLLFIGAVAPLIGAERGTYTRWALAGAVAAAAYLTRYNGIALVPGALGVALIAQRPLAQGLRLFGVFFAVWAVLISPWCLFLWKEVGDPFWNTNFRNIAIAALTDTPSRAQQGGFMTAVPFESVLEVIAVHPIRFVRVLVVNFVNHFWQDARELVGIPMAVVAVIGLLVGFRSWMNRRVLGFAFIGFTTYGLMLTVFYNPRFMLPLLCWWGAAAAGVVPFVAGFFTDRVPAMAAAPAWRRPKGLILAAFVIMAAAATYGGVRRSQDPVLHGGMPRDIALLAEKARASGHRFGPDTPIAARKPHLGYLLGAPTIPITEGNDEDIRQSGARYLVVSGIEVNVYPGLISMWSPKRPEDVPSVYGFVAQGAVPRKPEGYRIASLYAIRDPVPLPAKTDPVASGETELHGFSRVDFLRWKLAEWSLAWNNRVPAVDLLDRIEGAQQGRPEIQLLRGDNALESGDYDTAARYYDNALEERPRDAGLMLRLCAIGVLRGDDPNRFVPYMTEALGVWGISPPAPPERLADVAIEYIQLRDHAAALAPLVVVDAGLKNRGAVDPQMLKLLGYCYLELRHAERAEGYFREALVHAPEDGEIHAMLERIETGDW